MRLVRVFADHRSPRVPGDSEGTMKPDLKTYIEQNDLNTSAPFEIL